MTFNAAESKVQAQAAEHLQNPADLSRWLPVFDLREEARTDAGQPGQLGLSHPDGATFQSYGSADLTDVSNFPVREILGLIDHRIRVFLPFGNIVKAVSAAIRD